MKDAQKEKKRDRAIRSIKNQIKKQNFISDKDSDEIEDMLKNNLAQSLRIKLKYDLGNQRFKKYERYINCFENKPQVENKSKRFNSQDKVEGKILKKAQEEITDKDIIKELKMYLIDRQVEDVQHVLIKQLGKNRYSYLGFQQLVNQLSQEKRQIRQSIKENMQEIPIKFKGERIKSQIYEQLRYNIGQGSFLDQLEHYLQLSKKKHIRRLVKDKLGDKGLKSLQHLIDQLVQPKRMPVPGSKYLRNHQGVHLYLLPTIKAKYLSGETKTALVVGMTGVGKSTFLNSMVNRMMNVEADDPFRYIIVDDGQKDQSKSVTTEVTSYAIPKQGIMKYNIVLVDVPGMGDTNGIERDKENIENIKKALINQVPELSLILYVLKASDTRVTSEMQYVLSQVMGMFGKNVAANIQFILTFADQNIPPISEYLKQQFKGVIKGLDKQGWYLKVNNSDLFKKINPEDPHTKSFDIGMQCLDKLLKKLYTINAVSMSQSINVLVKKKEMQEIVQILHKNIDVKLQHQEQLRRLAKQIGTIKSDVLQKQNYKFVVKEEKVRKVGTTNNVTSCLNCKHTCHENCKIDNSAQKQKCCAMDEQGNCKVCPQKCNWKCHINSHQILQRYAQDVERTNQDLFKQYKVVMNDKNAKEKLLANMVIKYMSSLQETQTLIHQLKAANDFLNKHQLSQNKPTTIIQYLKQLINRQKSQKKAGYIDRLRQLQQMKSKEEKKNQLLNKVKKNQFSQQQIKKTICDIIPDLETRKIVEQEIQKKIKNQKFKLC